MIGFIRENMTDIITALFIIVCIIGIAGAWYDLLKK